MSMNAVEARRLMNEAPAAEIAKHVKAIEDVIRTTAIAGYAGAGIVELVKGLRPHLRARVQKHFEQQGFTWRENDDQRDGLSVSVEWN